MAKENQRKNKVPICHLLPGPGQGTHCAIVGAHVKKKNEGWACFSTISLILLGRASPDVFDPGLAIAPRRGRERRRTAWAMA